jgi:GAF domain-containing protein
LAVERQEPASLTEDDVELLETLSGLLAVALENARLFEQTEQSLHQVDALYRQQTEVAWQELLAARMAGSVKTQFEYTQKGKDREDTPRGPGLQAPIALRGETIGSLEIETPQSTRDWSEDDREVLEAVADEVAIALEQARLMEEVHRRATQLRTAAEIARDATSLLDVDTLLRRAINLIRDRFGFYHVAVFLLDQAGEFAVLREATGEAGRQLKASGHKLAVGSKSAVGHATEARESYVVHDVSADPYHRPNPLLPETQTELVLPLLSGLRVIGALDVQHTRHHTFTENDIAVLQILADQLGIAVQNALSYEEALRRAQREEAVLDLSSKVRATRNIDIMLQTAVRVLRKSMGARHATIRLAAHLDEPPGNGEEAGPLGIGRRGNGDGAAVSRPPGDKEAA